MKYKYFSSFKIEINCNISHSFNTSNNFCRTLPAQSSWASQTFTFILALKIKYLYYLEDTIFPIIH